MIDRFEELLRELSVQLDTTLHLDKIGACSLKIDEQFHVQIECDPHQERVLIATFICELPPGKFRENILKDALKANHPFPQNGTLAYSDRNNQLALFSYLPFTNLTGRKLSEFLNAFVEKTGQWRSAVDAGQTSGLTSSTTNPEGGSIFDIKQ